MAVKFTNTSLHNHYFPKVQIPRKLLRLVLLVVGSILLALFFKCNLFYFHGNSAENPKCRIPELQPFNESIQSYLATEATYSKLKEWWCKDFPILFNSTLESEIVPVVDLEVFRKHEIVSCCYKVIQRKEDKDKPDEYFKYSDECYELSLAKVVTKIPDEHEFIAIFCQDEKNRSKVYDMHAFVRVNEFQTPLNSNQDQLNILVLGVDSVPRMNFIRYMPKSYEYLMKKLNAVEMKGFNRNGLNTLECLMPMLTGQTETEVKRGCGKSEFYDTCSLIWRKFKGYRTLMAEDWASVAIFHHGKNGFRYPPVDHYLRPLALASFEEFVVKEGQFAHCQGPRVTNQVLLDYTKKFVHAMRKMGMPFFGFTWSTGLTHMELVAAKYADPFLVEALEWLESGGYLENTVLIVMSDHGVAWSKIKNTIQGQYESRLPLLYFVLPERFKSRYFYAYQNLVRNRERLTSTMDLYMTLSDLSDLEQLENDVVVKRGEGLKSGNRLPTGISQFLTISASRSCADAGINGFYCACEENIVEVSVNSTEIKEAALHAVLTMNEKIIKEHYSKCAKLELERVTHAQLAMIEDPEKRGNVRPSLILHYETNPGKGEFEALVMEYKERPKPDKWKMLPGYIFRLNLYGNQSYCMDDNDMKNFCYCNN